MCQPSRRAGRQSSRRTGQQYTGSDPLYIVAFSLDTTGSCAHNARQHPSVSTNSGPRGRRAPLKAGRPLRKMICSICRVSPCSASIPNAKLAVTGYAPMSPRRSAVMMAAARAAGIFCATSRRRSARASACARVTSALAHRCVRGLVKHPMANLVSWTGNACRESGHRGQYDLGHFGAVPSSAKRLRW